MATSLVAGSLVWVENEKEAYEEGTVVAVNGSVARVRVSGSEVDVDATRLYPRDPDAPPGGVDDMTKLAYLHEPGVLDNLACRYSLDEIYTYTGSILIAVNPFASLPHLYNTHMMEQYKGMPLGELSPHVFAVADQAYRAMMVEGKSQAVLVSGESGAGKTETTKLIMQYLAYMGGRVSEGRTVEQQVLQSNPLLEAFGNAKTVRNNNSSRFGKFVEIQFDQSGRISGAAVRTYLLERSRVVQIADPERNYHCFYQLCSVASAQEDSPYKEEASRYKLSMPEEFHYLNQSSCFDLPGCSNVEEYEKTRSAMDVVGISDAEQESVFRVVAAILHLGNVEFIGSDSSELKDEKAQFHLNTAAELLMCDAPGLLKSLTKHVLFTAGERIERELDPSSAHSNRDTLAKTIYARLFDWLVTKINQSIGQDPTATTIVGVLDIYGFESFRQNSFEQFCINLANEKLQQHFNQHVFKMEQEEYEREAINWSYIDFVDNQDVLDLIEKKPTGIIALLDEQCMFPKSSAETFATKLYTTLQKHGRFSKPKLGRNDFTVDHYAGQVTYQTDLFLEKNKDYVVAEHQALLGASSCPFVAGLFPSLDDGTGSKASYKFSSIGTRFKTQLQELMVTLNTTEPHYIRCVKPNGENRPSLFWRANVLHQLRCGGVLEAVRISCAGYPTRRPFDEFLDRFGLLAPGLMGEGNGENDEKALCTTLLEKLGLTNYQVGKTKVFLRAGQMADLDGKRQQVLYNMAHKVQRAMRTFMARKRFLRMRESAVIIQKNWRGYRARKEFRDLKEDAAAVKIQKHVRGWLARKHYKQAQRAAIVIQAAARGRFARKEFHQLKEEKAALSIQTKWRSHAEQTHFKQLRKASIVFQCSWRCRMARRELRGLKMAARETGALQEAKSKLEKECEDLKLRLQLEKMARVNVETKNQDLSKVAVQVGELQAALEAVRAELATERAQHKQTQEAVRSAPAVQEVASKEALEENVKLQKLLEALQQGSMVTEKKLEDAKRERDEAAKRAEDAERRLLTSQTENSGLLERLSNLESENQVLRQQALATTPQKGFTASRLPSLFQPTRVNSSDGPATPEPRRLADAFVGDERPSGDVDQRRQKLAVDKQQSDQEALLKCIKEDVGFSSGKPVAACIVYKSLIHWHSFEAERTNVFDRIISTIGTAIEKGDNNEMLAYWLSNTATLLYLLQRTVKAGSGAPGTPGSFRRRTSTSAPSLFSKMTQGFLAAPAGPPPAATNGGSPGGTGVTGYQLRVVEAKYPALLFKQQLTAYVEKIYGMIRENTKKEISPMLGSCIQAPRTNRALGKPSGRSPSAVTTPPLGNHWGSIITSLSRLLNLMRGNKVTPFLVRKLFTQIFAYINVQLFNSLLLRRECCSFSNGEYVKAGLAELEQWIHEAQNEYAGPSWEELKHIRQAVGFLVLGQKSKKTVDEITHDLCPVLSVQQLYRISTMYWDDKYGTHSVAPEVISSMRVIMTEDNNDAGSNSFLLDDDPSIPFSVDDISKSMEEVDLSDVDPPPLLKDIPSFTFLRAPHE